MISRLLAASLFFLLGTGPARAQVVFSRRVYAEHGRTYQQIWEWRGGTLTALTHSPRNHYQPMCSRDGQRIYFLAGPADWDYTVWSLDRATGQEKEILDHPNSDLIGVASDGAPLVLTGEENYPGDYGVIRIGRPPVILAPSCFGARLGAAVSPDGTRLAFSTCTRDDQIVHYGKALFVTDTATGKSKIQVGDCNRPVWSRDGSRIACLTDQDFVILDVAASRELDRIPFRGRPTPPAGETEQSTPQIEDWSPDGKSLLVGMPGELIDAPVREFPTDNFVLDLSTNAWTAVGKGGGALWLPGRDTILMETPAELTPLGNTKKNVLVSHLALVDLATRQLTRLTSGATNNFDPSHCGVETR
jgi:hypothetical protein